MNVIDKTTEIQRLQDAYLAEVKASHEKTEEARMAFEEARRAYRRQEAEHEKLAAAAFRRYQDKVRAL